MTPDNETVETPEKKTRRTPLKIELDAFADLVTALRPLTPEQRARLTESAMQFLGKIE